jgi:hypothetical protein
VPLLKNFSEEISFCCEGAVEAKKRADETHDPVAKVDFLKMEKPRLLFARSFNDQLDAVTREQMREYEIGPCQWPTC